MFYNSSNTDLGDLVKNNIKVQYILPVQSWANHEDGFIL